MSKQHCVLIVDDEEFCRDTLYSMLVKENYQLAFAKNGHEALYQAEVLTPDVILLDVMMPNMSGFEVCERLRINPWLAEVPIVLVTALDDRDSMLRGIEAGADDFITKPIDMIQLRARVRTIVRLNRQRRLAAERNRLQWVIEQSEDGYILLQEGRVVQHASSNARFYLDVHNQEDNQISFDFLEQAQHSYRLEPAEAWEDWPTPNVGNNPRYLVRPETQQSPVLWLQVTVLDVPDEHLNTQLVHLRDVTNCLKLQENVWSFQKLVSHKLRSPLNGLVSLQYLQKSRDLDATSSQTQMMMDIARSSAERLESQILDILRYVDTQRPVTLGCQDYLPVSNTKRLVKDLQMNLDFSNVLVLVDDALRGKALKISSTTMELILGELFSNCRKFHPQGEPSVEVSILSVPEQNRAILQIKDNGRHIPAEKLAKVWMPYYQNEKTFTGEVTGMGLGLAMIAKIIWSHDGDCRLYNRSDRAGIVVELSIPLEDIGSSDASRFVELKELETMAELGETLYR